MTELETLVARIATVHAATTDRRGSTHPDWERANKRQEKYFNDALAALAAYASKRDDAIKRAISAINKAGWGLKTEAQSMILTALNELQEVTKCPEKT